MFGALARMAGGDGGGAHVQLHVLWLDALLQLGDDQRGAVLAVGVLEVALERFVDGDVQDREP
ncbi:MAG: hypothetical protein ACK55I_24120, partial [bacterium]